MRNIRFGMANMHEHGSAYYDFLRLRKLLFVDTLGWEIPHDDVVEMDQYDNPTAFYSVVLGDDDAVIGGARTMPVTARWGEHGCMLSDAIAGKLRGIPSDIVQEPFDEAHAWECTRLVISDNVSTHDARTRCLSLIVDGLIEIATERGATELVSLSPPPLQRALQRLGHSVTRLGRPYRNAGDGRTYSVLRMEARVARRDGEGQRNYRAAS